MATGRGQGQGPCNAASARVAGCCPAVLPSAQATWACLHAAGLHLDGLNNDDALH